MREKILIVGTASKVSQAISETLTNNHYELIGTYNKTYPQNPECYSNLLKINFLKKSDIEKLDDLKNISDIIFSIGKIDFLDEKKAKVNYVLLKNLIDYLKKINKNIRIIFCSSSAVYGDNNSKIISEFSDKKPTNYYGKYKLKAEEYLINSNNKYIIIRFPIIFGSYFSKKFARLLDALKNNKACIFGKGNNHFSFIHQNDLSEFILKLIKKKEISNTDFNIASGYTTQDYYMKKISKLLNQKTPKYKSIDKLLKIADEQLIEYKKSGAKPSLFKEDIISLSRNRIYNIDKAKKLINWHPKYDIDKCIKDTFFQTNLLSRWDGIKILKFVYGNKLLPVRIYRNPMDFNPRDFNKKTEEIWSVTIRDEEGDIINTDHLFSRDHNNIRKFMLKNKKPNKVYIVRLSPPRDKILFYGSFLIDKKNFKEKVMITISKNPEDPFVTRKEGKSLKLLPRDFIPDYNLVHEKGRLKGKFIKKYSGLLEKDINKLLKFLKKTKREDLTIPVLFIIKKKGVQYISLGL